MDISIPALTKYSCGHADVLMGAVEVREPLGQQLWTTVRQLGICGGLQILGRMLLDPLGLDGSGEGLGLLPLQMPSTRPPRAA